MNYDVIIIGAGAAGLTSAIYCSRRELKTLVLSSNLGGQASIAWEIENYPGSNEPNGAKLMKKFEEQGKKFGAQFKYEHVRQIKKEGKEFVAITAQNKYSARSIILASGKSPRKLGLKDEEKFEGKGIAYCATCDAPLFRDKIVAVVGGGNSALDASMLLSGIAKKVYLIHRRDEFRAEKYLVEKALKHKNIETILDSEVKGVAGDQFLNKIMVENNKTGKKQELEVNGLFVEIGFVVEPKLASDLGVKMDEKNQIIVDSSCQTSVEGVFGAGDVTDTPYKQIVISGGEGAKAALAAYEFLQGKKMIGDWGRSKDK